MKKESPIPTIVKGFFYNKRPGEYIMLACGQKYRERVLIGKERKFVQGR